MSGGATTEPRAPEAMPARIAPLAMLPLFHKLDGRKAVVAGGSEGALWKAELLAAAGAGDVPAGLTITVTVTGHGLKDIDTPLEQIGSIVDTVVDADVHAAAEAAGL